METAVFAHRSDGLGLFTEGDIRGELDRGNTVGEGQNPCGPEGLKGHDHTRGLGLYITSVGDRQERNRRQTDPAGRPQAIERETKGHPDRQAVRE